MPNNTIQLKICTKCGLNLPYCNFYKNKNNKDGLMYHCKQCSKKYTSDNKDILSKSGKKYYKKNYDKILTYTKNYFQNNKERINKRLRDRYSSDIEYRNKCIDRVLSRKDVVNKQLREKYNTDTVYRIKCCLRSRFYQLVKNKSDSIINIIGCTIDELIIHLENQFQPGMTWDNHGVWHIDHIIPCAAFNLTKEEEQKKCFHYTNLQPLWAKDNISKGTKIYIT